MVKLFKKKRERILEKFNEAEIIQVSEKANFFGLESKGSKQVRGNGVLVLLKDELFFQMWLPKRIIKIPVRSIKDISTPTHHLRKTKHIKLLKVEFINQDGNKDSAAWWVKDLKEWTTQITALL